MCAVLGTAVSAIDVTTQCEQLWNAKLDRSETDRYNKLHGLMHGRLVPPSHMAIFDFFMPSWSCEDKQFIGEVSTASHCTSRLAVTLCGRP